MKYLLLLSILFVGCTEKCDEYAITRQYTQSLQNCGGSEACVENLTEQYNRRMDQCD